MSLPPIDLTVFDPPFGAGEYYWGEPVPGTDGLTHWKDHQYHIEVLSWHYHDYLGTHAYVQVWDYRQQGDPHQHWQYKLLLHRPTRQYNDSGFVTGSTWAWTIRREYDHYPSHAEVGADVDTWVKDPDI